MADPSYGSIRCNTDTFRLAPMNVVFVFEPIKPNIKHYAGDGTYGYALGIWKRVVTLEDVYLKNTSDLEKILDYFKDLHKTGTAWKIEWDINAAADMLEFDGDTPSMLVLQIGKARVEKVSNGAGTVYKINGLKFEEASK